MALLTHWSGPVKLILDFRPPELGENAYLLFKAIKFVVICYISLRKLKQKVTGQLLVGCKLVYPLKGMRGLTCRTLGRAWHSPHQYWLLPH